MRRAPRAAHALLLAASVLAAAAAVPPAAAACLDEWHGRLAREIDDERRGLSALLPLRLAQHLRSAAVDPLALAERLEAIARDRATDPAVAAAIDLSLVDVDLLRGDLEAAAARRSRLGLVERYLVGAPGAPLTGAGEGSWRAFDAGPDGVLPLSELFHPAESTSAQAVFWVVVERAGTVALRFGADDGGTVDVGGVAIGGPFGDHDLGYDQHARFARLGPGRHRVRFTVRQDRDAWGLVARVTAPDGSPLPDTIRVEWPEDPAAALSEPPGEAAEGSGDDPLAHLERRARRGDPSDRALYAIELALRGRPDRRSTKAHDVLREARDGDRWSSDAAWAASIVEEDASARREALREILERRPEDPGALRRLAQHYSEHENVHEAARVVERALAVCPGDPALLGWHATLTLLPGAPGLADARLSMIVEGAPQPALVQRLALLLVARGQPRRAAALLDAHLARYGGDVVALEARAGIAGRAGDEVLRTVLIERAAAIQPYVRGWTLQIVRAALADGRAEDALRRLAPLRARDPTDPLLLELEGEARLAGGDTEGAGTSWREAVAHGAPPDRLDERIASLTGVTRSFGDEWAVDPAALDASAADELPDDPPVVMLSRVNAYRVQSNGLSERFVQAVLLVRRPEQADAARAHSVTYSPSLQRVSIQRARLVRRDGAVVHAAETDRPLLPDPELRMWYDTRVVTLGFPPLQAGDRIELRYRVSDRGPVNPIADRYFGEILGLGAPVPVLASRLVVDAAADLPVRHALVHLPVRASVASEARGPRRVDVIDVPALPAYPDVPGAPPPAERVPHAILGTARDWNDLGAMYATLLENQLRITPEIRDVVAAARARAGTDRALVEELYRWVIENTRYVALELGIHALKPYDSATVFRRRHGDCKDKASLLVTMLRDAGIDAHVALVRTRDNGRIDTSIPTFAHFDHAIVRVPGEDVWLDGTVLHHGPRELPTGDRDALALVVDTGGGSGTSSGELLGTPAATPDSDVVLRQERIEPAIDGSARVEVVVLARGEAASTERAWFRLRDNRIGMLRQRLRDARPDASVVDAEFTSLGLLDDEARYRYVVDLARLGLPEGARASFPLAAQLPSLPIEVPAAGRDVPLRLPPPSRRAVSTTFVLPAGWRVTALPAAGTVDAPWGRVRVEVERAGENVVVRTGTEFRGGVVGTDEVARLAAFVDDARQLLEQRVVMEAP